MSGNFQLIIPDESFATFDGKDTPFQLILSDSQLSQLDAGQIAGANLFILAFIRNKLKIVAFLNIESVLQYDDKYGAAGYLLESNKIRTFRVCRLTDLEFAPYINTYSPLDNCVHLLDPKDAENIFQTIISSSVTSLVGVEKKIRDEISEHINYSKSARSVAKELIHTVVRLVPLNKAKKLPSDKNISSFASLACQCVRDNVSLLKQDAIIEEICKIDPLYFQDLVSEASVGQEVDTIFTPLDPATIRPRIFLANGRMLNPEEQLRKTQMAEVRHQEIVKQLAQYLISIGLHPLETRSIDLAVRLGNVLTICEIKSANAENIQNQMDKGVIQLLRYSTAINAEESAPCCALLIVENCPDFGNFIQGKNMLARLGYSLMVYNDKRSWPDRIDGLSEFLGNLNVV